MGRQLVAGVVFLATCWVAAAFVPESWPFPVDVGIALLCVAPSVATLMAFRARDRRRAAVRA